MTAKGPGPKLPPEEVAAATVRAIRENIEECYPGPIASAFIADYRSDPKALERRLATRLPHR